MIWLLSFLFSTTVSHAAETRIKIAIIDTGYTHSEKVDKYLCVGEHVSFVDDSPFQDTVGHGTNIAGLITNGLDPNKYCIVIVKFFKGPKGSAKVVESILYALTQKVSYMNLSLGGQRQYEAEKQAIIKALNSGVKVAAAAGNDGKNLDLDCYYYPACYNDVLKNPRFHIVGSNTISWHRYSNYGSIVKYREDGTNKGLPPQTGTSQATAIHLNKWIKSGD